MMGSNYAGYGVPQQGPQYGQGPAPLNQSVPMGNGIYEPAWSAGQPRANQGGLQQAYDPAPQPQWNGGLQAPGQYAQSPQGLINRGRNMQAQTLAGYYGGGNGAGGSAWQAAPPPPRKWTQMGYNRDGTPLGGMPPINPTAPVTPQPGQPTPLPPTPQYGTPQPLPQLPFRYSSSPAAPQPMLTALGPIRLPRR